MNSKIIKLHMPSQIDMEDYVVRLRELSKELQQLTTDYDKDPRVVLADLTYVIVKEDILSRLTELTEPLTGCSNYLGSGGYVRSLDEMNHELQQIAEQFGEGVRSALADLTYLVVGDDIMATLERQQ